MQQTQHTNIQALLHAIRTIKIEDSNAIHLINKNLLSPKKSNKKVSKSLKYSQQKIQKDHYHYEPQILQFYTKLFEAKCKDLRINVNTQKLKVFVSNLKKKNRDQSKLNLEDCSLYLISCQLVNQEVSNYNRINLSQNYLKNCLKLLPNLFHQNLTELVLKNCGLQNAQFEFLFSKLLDTCIYRLCLSSPLPVNRNRITKYESFYNFLRKNETLGILELGYLRLQNSKQFFEAIAKSNIISLNLQMNNKAKGLTKQINNLNLRGNKLTSLDSLKIGQNNLQYLDLSKNQLPVRQLDHIFLSKPPMNLKKLILDQNPLQSELASFEKFLRDSNFLVEFSAKNCLLIEDGIIQIFYALEKNTSLQILDLSYNKISLKAVQILAKVFRSNKYSKLRQIKLIQCEIPDKGGELLAKNLIYNENLQQLDLTQNRLNIDSSLAFAICLRKNMTLLKLQLAKNVNNYDNIREIKLSLQRNLHNRKSKRIENSSKKLQNNTFVRQQYLIRRKQNELQQEIKHLKHKFEQIKMKKQTLQSFELSLKQSEQYYNSKIQMLQNQIREMENQQKSILLYRDSKNIGNVQI